MSSNLTAASVELTMPYAHLLAGAVMPFEAPNLLGRSGWRTDVQGVGTPDCGSATTKFSTRLGPPSCSPPV